MGRLIAAGVLGAVLTFALLTVAACSPPAAPTQTAPATSAPAKQPTSSSPATNASSTAAPQATTERKVDFPEKGKSLQLICGWTAGGSIDASARMLSTVLEKELGVPVNVVTKAGSAGQIGITELARSKPDGYTIGTTPVPGITSIYLDPEKQAIFTLDDFTPLALQVVDPAAITVRSDSPYRTMKDLVDAAKAQPGMISMATSAKGSAAHLGTLQLQKVTGAEFNLVHFEGGAQSRTALLGGHVDSHFSWVGENASIVQGGQARYLAVMDDQRSKFYPDVPTLTEEGYKGKWLTSHGYSAPAGLPKDVEDVLVSALKRAIQSDELQRLMENTGQEVRYLGPVEFKAFMIEFEDMVKPLIEGMRAS